MSRCLGAVAAGCLALVAVSGLWPTPAAAQSVPVNCAALSGSPFLCLKNMSGKAVTAIQAVAPGFGWYNPSAWISVMVPPGGVSVVRMPTYTHGDVQNLVVRSDDGQPHYFWNVNVRRVTSLEIRW